MKNPFILHCYARPEGRHYIAVCLELALVTKGRSIPVVRDKMNEAITGYIKSLDKDNFKDLFPRYGYASLLYYLDYFRVVGIIQYYNLRKDVKRKVHVFIEQIIPKNFTVESLCPSQ